MDHFSVPAHYFGMVTLPRFIALVLLGSFGIACSSHDTLLETGAAGATMGGGAVSHGESGSAATTGGTAEGGALQQGTGGTQPSAGNPAAGGSADMSGAAGEATAGASSGTGGTAPCKVPESCTPCSSLTTASDCTAQPGCHAVFIDRHDCRCAAIGCCAKFSSCVDGAQADCAVPKQFTCTIAMPYCEGPNYVISYKNGCYEGCVPAIECAP